ncbi:MAG: carboxypeptidase regulatory-like domain-containing protein [Isosphaeraceae bacterium]|nr:carboxypeptidase regulatory-like domain-containing protein [Isosphaeraceae bacterium]
MNTLSTWIVAASEDPMAPLLWLTVKLTVYLAMTWLLHATLSRRNPRWRVLLWRSSGVGFVVLAGFFYFPPFWSWPLPSPRGSGDRTAAMATTQGALSLVGSGPAVERGARTGLASRRTAPSGPSSREGRGKSVILPKHPASSADAIASDRSERARAGLTRFVLAGRRSLYLRVALAIWCGGVLLGILRTVIGLGRLARIRAQATEVPPWVIAQGAQVARGLGLKSACAIRATRDLQSPCLIGLWRPTILLPEPQCEADSRAELPSIFAHELAHLLRHDLAWNALFHGLSIVLWPHPLVWRVRVTHADACDAVADAVAAAFVGDANLYARTLARLTLRVTTPEVTMGLSMARKSCTLRRIEAIHRHVFRARLSQSRATSAVVVAALGTILLGGLGLERSSARSAQAVEAQTPDGPSTTHKREDGTKVAPREPGVVSGDVVDAETRVPVAGAEVLLLYTGIRRTKADDQGRFRFERIPHGNYRIWAFKEDLASPREPVFAQDAPLPEGVRFAPIRLLMRPGKQVKVTVASAATGRPIEEAEVSLGYPDRRKATTGSDGVAIVRGLLPGKYEVTVLAAGHAREERDIDLTDSPPVTPLSVALSQGGLVQGKLTDKDKRPLAGIRVYYRSVGNTYGYFGQSPTTDEQGRYRNAHLPLGTQIEIAYSSEDHLTAKRVVTLTGEEREQQVDVQLEKRPRGGSVAGVVTDPEGKPIAGAKVGNYGNRSDESRQTTTDANGRFVLHDLLKDHVGHEIVVSARGFSPVLRRVEPGPEESPSEVSVRLQRGHFVHGRVENGAGEPLKGASVWISNRSGPVQAFESVQADEQGRFHLDSLAGGNTLRISAEGYSTRENVTLPFDGDEMISVKLEPMGVLRGRVVDAATGQAIKQFRVRLGFPAERREGDVRGSFDSRLGATGRAFQTEDGTFTLNGLTNRLALAVKVESEGYQRSTLPRVEAQPAGGAIPLQIALTKTDPARLATVSGTLLDHRRNPVAGVELRLIVSPSASTGEDDNRFNWALIDRGQLGRQGYVAQFLSAVSDAQGRFTFRDILPGMYLQLAYWGPNAPKSRSLAFAKTKPGMGQTVTIDVPNPASISGSFDSRTFPDSGSMQLSRKDDGFHSYKFELAAGQSEFRFENVPPGDYWLSIMHRLERSKDRPEMFTLRPIAARSLTVEPGRAYKVQFTEKDRVDHQLY